MKRIKVFRRGIVESVEDLGSFAGGTLEGFAPLQNSIALGDYDAKRSANKATLRRF